MKFDKNEKNGVEKEGSKKKLIIGIVVGFLLLLLILTPILMGGLK